MARGDRRNGQARAIDILVSGYGRPSQARSALTLAMLLHQRAWQVRVVWIYRPHELVNVPAGIDVAQLLPDRPAMAWRVLWRALLLLRLTRVRRATQIVWLRGRWLMLREKRPLVGVGPDTGPAMARAPRKLRPQWLLATSLSDDGLTADALASSPAASKVTAIYLADAAAELAFRTRRLRTRHVLMPVGSVGPGTDPVPVVPCPGVVGWGDLRWAHGAHVFAQVALKLRARMRDRCPPFIWVTDDNSVVHIDRILHDIARADLEDVVEVRSSAARPSPLPGQVVALPWRGAAEFAPAIDAVSHGIPVVCFAGTPLAHFLGERAVSVPFLDTDKMAAAIEDCLARPLDAPGPAPSLRDRIAQADDELVRVIAEYAQRPPT